MSKYSERIQEILRNASGKKFMDKKKSVIELLELYENKEAVNEICENSEKNIQGVVNWSYIIYTVHKIVLNETDKHASKDTYSKTIIALKKHISTLVIKTIQCASSYKIPLLKCSDIIPLILQILETSVYEYYHETYMHILVSYILPLRSHQVKISLEQWQELLKIFISLYKNVFSITNKRTTLEALQMIAYYGCLYSDLLPNLKGILPFLETVFLDVRTNQEILAESAYKLAHIVCQQIAIECRHNLCQFSENVLPSIISSKSSMEKYKLLLLFIKIHHPKGICNADDGAYAVSWEKWHAILKSMYLMILKDLKADILQKSFIYLASEVFTQILKNTNVIVEKISLDESDCIQIVKRRKIANKIDGLIDIIANNNIQEAWPIVQILTVLLEKYPECLRSHDYADFLKILVSLLTQSCKEEIIMDNLYELCAILLANEKILPTTCIENSNMYWDKIWDILLRSFNVNQNEITSHKLIQLFIINNKITNPNVLLRLYLTNDIKWSVMSLRTLIVLCEYLSLSSDITMFNINTCSPTMNSNSVRLSLLKWALNIPWHKLATEIVIDELCLLLISITSKLKYEKQIKFKKYDMNNSCDCLNNGECLKPSYEQIENSYLLLAFKTNLFIDKKEEDIQYNLKSNEKMLYMQDIVTSLQVQLCDILDEGSDSDDIYIRIIKIAIVAKMISIIKQLSMINIDETFLQRTMKIRLDSVYTSLANIDPSRCKYIYLCNITKALNMLYGTLYDTEVSKTIILSSTPEVLKKIFSLMNIEDDEIADYQATKDCYENYSSFQNKRKSLNKDKIQNKQCNICNKSIIRIQTSKALALFCCMNVGEEKCEIQRKLMDNLLTIDMYDLSRTTNCKMAIIVLESLSKYGKQNLSINHGEIPIKDILVLYQECQEDETAVRYILNILPFFLKYAVDYNFNLDDLMKIILQQNRYKKKYGYRVYIEFTKCLLEIIRVSPTLLYYVVSNEFEQIMPIMDSILLSFTDSLFIVQLEAIKCIQNIYLSKHIDFKWKESLFMKIEASVNKLTISSHEMNVHEKETKIASALLGLVAIIFSNGTFQCSALLSMLHLITDQKIDIQIIPKVLHTITDQISYLNLIEDNLSYLVTYWYNSKYSSESFPWQLVQCTSEEQFYETYINILAFIKFQSFKLSNVTSLCNYVTLSFQQITENIFPQILTWLLYCINEHEDNAKKKLANKIFHKLISNEEEFIEVKKFSILFKEKFEETLICIIERLHDENYVKETLGVQVSFSMSNPPHFKHETVKVCLKYMQENFFAQEMSIQDILAHNCPNILQKILLHLISNIYKQKFVEHKLKAFHQYMFFCTLIVQKLQQSNFDTLSMYIVKDISYSLLHIIKGHEDILLEIASKYFYEFVKQVLPIRNEEIKEVLSFTVTTLIPIVQAEKMPVTLEILNFLLIEQKDVLNDAIEKLNSFPNVPIFQEIRNVHNALKYKTGKIYTLQEEVQHFLNSLIDKNINYSLEDIIHLRQQLHTRKEEFQVLYNKLETLRGFAEDYASSMLHQLIYKLIKLTASSDVNVSIEASKCLGEIGPNDLTSMILYLEKSHVNESSDLIEILTYKIIIKMTELLFQSDVEVRKVSSDVLNALLSSSWGQKLLNIKYIEHLKSVLCDTQVTLPLSYIKPFITQKNSKTKKGLVKVKMSNILNPQNSIWTIQTNGSYTSWITELTCKILKCFTGFYSENLVPICALSTDICEIILPRIIFLIISVDKKFTPVICSCINQFFDHNFNSTTQNLLPTATCKTVNCDHQIVNCMLNIVNYIRIQVADNVCLELNYMYIAKAAQYCAAFFTAILYAEMSCENILNDCNNFTNISKIDHVYELAPDEGKMIQSILRDTYAKIGDSDAIHGTGSSHLQDHSTRIQHYVHTHEWNKVILAQDVELSFGNMTVIKEMANGLHQSGFQYLLGNMIHTMSKNNEKIDEDIQYECSWRLSNWNFSEINQALYATNDCKSKSHIIESDYHFYHYQALKYFHEGNETGIQNAIENARISIIKALKNISLESSKTIYEKLMQLQLIREIEELSSAKSDEYGKVLQKWQQQDISNFNEFQYIEPILTQRTIMYKINSTLDDSMLIKDALFNTYLDISKIAADKDNLHVATRSLAVLAKQVDLPPKVQDQLLYQESLLARLRNDLEIGRFLLRNLMHKNTLDTNLQAQVLRAYGDWMAETKSENPQAIIRKYYIKSIDASSSINNHTTDSIKNLHGTRVALARFADIQYEQICMYMKSSQFESLKECITPMEGVSMQSITKDKDVRRAFILNQRQNINDAEELEHIGKEKDNYLTLALQYYLLVLQESEDYNLLIFRIVALWLDNMKQKDVNSLLNENLNKIPSFKFIPLIPQLAAHINNVFNAFSEKIYSIMERCALDHPHHTLPVLLALKNLYGDYEYNTTRTSKTVEPKVLGAQKLLQELTKTNISSIVDEMDKLSHSLVMLANLATSSNKPGSIVNIPKNQEILEVKNFNNVLVPTLTINVQPCQNYNNIIGISTYVKTYETVGGLNTPKKLICIGTDGISRYQLVKGKDDLRQDAVMQQVFSVMNILLKAYKETKRRKLMIRTYKVVPLTQRSGILEWCDNTVPIMFILTGTNFDSGLHKKYYPKDYTARLCREKLSKVEKDSTDIKVKVFMDCCAHMHPVLHHFFMERYPSPETWFERRLAYTRSIATTSIAGYILGLGDRHLNNILLDQTTAEVIHIDFGIAFEQGKVLPVPETIPFRLTQNIEVAMGVSGIEGTMRQCCEKTLTVLRDKRQIIITLLQVLLYDPLFTWTITPAKARNIQSDSSSNQLGINQNSTGTNKTAERALLRIEQKLQGTEEGLPSSVSGQVERLMQQARDPVNLSRIYCGWQPYL